MTYSDGELESTFWADYPDPVQQALIRCVFSSYRTAHDKCKHFPPNLARDLRGYYRWVQLRDEMLGLGDRFPGITATSEEYHTLLTARRIKLIACSARDPGSPFRPATYKMEYANKSLDLFDPPPLRPSDDDYLFVVLKHGVDCREPRQPAFGRILFIAKDMKIAHDFSLFARHKDLVESLWISLSNGQDSQPDIRLRDDDEEQPQ